MTRKQWINDLSDDEATKIHTTFRQLDKTLFTVPIFSIHQGKEAQKQYPGIGAGLDQYRQHKRTVVRNFLRSNKLTKRDINVQYGRLAAGLSLNLKVN